MPATRGRAGAERAPAHGGVPGDGGTPGWSQGPTLKSKRQVQSVEPYGTSSGPSPHVNHLMQSCQLPHSHRKAGDPFHR